MDYIDVAFAGERVGQVFEGQRSFDLVVRYNEQNRNRAEAIRNSLIDAHDGKKIPLHYVATVDVTGNSNSVNRENVQRKIVVSANVAGRDLRSVVNDIRASVDESITLPEGYRVEYGGQFESEERAIKMLLITSFGAILLIFLLLLRLDLSVCLELLPVMEFYWLVVIKYCKKKGLIFEIQLLKVRLIV